MRIQTILNRVEKFKSFVVRRGAPGGARRRPGTGRPDQASEERPGVLLRLRTSRPRLRPPGGTAIRVRADLGDPGLPGLPDAAGELQAVRGDRRDGAVVRRQEPTDDDLPLVSGDLGQEAELERGRLDLPHVVGQRLPGGGARGRVGPGASGPERGDGPGRGRDRLGPRAHVFDAGVRHRRRRRSGCWPWPRSGPKRACVRAWRVSASRSARG